MNRKPNTTAPQSPDVDDLDAQLRAAQAEARRATDALERLASRQEEAVRARREAEARTVREAAEAEHRDLSDRYAAALADIQRRVDDLAARSATILRLDSDLSRIERDHGIWGGGRRNVRSRIENYVNTRLAAAGLRGFHYPASRTLRGPLVEPQPQPDPATAGQPADQPNAGQPDTTEAEATPDAAGATADAA